jgi:hypothetical protein
LEEHAIRINKRLCLVLGEGCLYSPTHKLKSARHRLELPRTLAAGSPQFPRRPLLEKLSEKSGSLRVEASEGDETSRKSSDSLLGNPKMEAPGATLDPFQTVSLGRWVHKGASAGVAEFRMHARYQEVAVPTDLLLALGAKRSRY